LRQGICFKWRSKYFHSPSLTYFTKGNVPEIFWRLLQWALKKLLLTRKFLFKKVLDKKMKRAWCFGHKNC